MYVISFVFAVLQALFTLILVCLMNIYKFIIGRLERALKVVNIEKIELESIKTSSISVENLNYSEI